MPTEPKPNILDGTTVRPMTDAEFAQWKADAADLAASQQAANTVRQSALAKLTALGLTDAEIAALVGA